MDKKEKIINPQIVVHGTVEKPYYEISYYDTTDSKWHIGYSSYNLQTVKKFLDNYFEIIEIDVEPVKREKWEVVRTHNNFIKHMYKCPACENNQFTRSNYCPNCGAKMDGESND